jgi:hypothetical protein
LHVSHLAGQFGSEMIAATWIPGRRWNDKFLPGVIEQVSFGWASNLAREFAPEIKRLVRKVRK